MVEMLPKGKNYVIVCLQSLYEHCSYPCVDKFLNDDVIKNDVSSLNAGMRLTIWEINVRITP